MATETWYTFIMSNYPKSHHKVSVKRLTRGTELRNGEVFINMRPSKTPGKVTVRLFDKSDDIVTRLWNETATVNLS